MGKLTVGNVYDVLNTFTHFETQEKWDNSGLLAGAREREVRGIYCTLDVSLRAAEDAVRKGCNLIVSHHPILFGGRKNLREEDEEGKMLCFLVRQELSVISLHTCYDKTEGGVNDILAEKLGLKEISHVEGDEDGYLRIGSVEPIRLSDFAKNVENVLGDAVRVYGDGDRLIRRAAVLGGAGGEYASAAFSAGADVFVTGEMRYHDCLTLAQSGLATVQAGHDATEKPAVDALADVLATNFAIPVYKSQVDLYCVNVGK